MSTFDYLTPADAVAAAWVGAPDHERITGLKGIDADRMPNMITRTAAGNARQPSASWDAHGHLDKFKEIARVEWAKDADPGTAEVFYADGTTDLIKSSDLLCVERPIKGAEPAPHRIESSAQDLTDETGYNGTNWPTHTVDVWIQNDGKFLDTASNYAKIDETGAQLRDYLHRLLFNRSGLACEELRRITGDDRHTLGLVADSLTRDTDDTDTAQQAFARIDWEYLRASLLDLP
ncbi:hypothetical protein [Streptomyces sp. NPDC088727]|uniref:hypothetical protein n=1 Tax=Streptomyces sp. NPDC088727 TaxID=3365875 RepID=UPI0037FA0228